MKYAILSRPDGLTETFLVGENFIGDDSCAMIFRDNIFYGGYLRKSLQDAVDNAEHGKATILAIM